jgi:general secretion pathway protein J
MMTSRSGRRPSRGAPGFTLVEVLVALLIMALLTGLAWQGMDGIMRARDASRELIDRSVRLSTVLTQWEQDLQAVVDTEVVPALAFDGQTLRLTRRVDAGVAVMAWSLRADRWQRWVGPVCTHAGELQQAWLGSQQLLGTEPGQLTMAEGASQWQVYFHRGGQWSNAQSSGDLSPAAALPASAAASAAAAAPRELLPAAVRLVLTLDGARLTRDIALGPSGP